MTEDAAERGDAVDVVVVGGGPAGLSAALALGRSRRRVLVVDAGEPRNAPAAALHSFLTRDGTDPAELLELGRAEVARYGVEHHHGTAVSTRREGTQFLVELDDNRTVIARRLVVTTGLVDQLPPVSGLAERWGRDVIHCPYCHGWEVRDRVIGVLATAAVALHQVGLFRQLSDRVILLRHTGPEPEPAQAATLAARGVEIIEGGVTALEVHGDVLAGVRLADGHQVALDVLVVASRFVARSNLLTELGVSTAPHPSGLGVHGPADPTGRTDVPVVWVAGNVTDIGAQISTAASQGNLAGAAVNADLVGEDAALALEGA